MKNEFAKPRRSKQGTGMFKKKQSVKANQSLICDPKRIKTKYYQDLMKSKPGNCGLPKPKFFGKGSPKRTQNRLISKTDKKKAQQEKMNSPIGEILDDDDLKFIASDEIVDIRSNSYLHPQSHNTLTGEPKQSKSRKLRPVNKRSKGLKDYMNSTLKTNDAQSVQTIEKPFSRKELNRQ